jgi:nitrate/nitrite transporter NarK
MSSQPTSAESSAPASIANRRFIVTASGTGINLALGVLYTWSMFKDAIGKELGWKDARLNDPYALCCLVFSFAMILAGRCQDKIGPRATATIGGLLVGGGLLLISQTQSYTAWVLGFGGLVGAGIGFGYSSATPAALKWFPPSRTGLVAGVVVAGFGLAPVYLSPLSKYLLTAHGLRGATLFYAFALGIAVCGLAQLLANPPAGYVPDGGAPPAPGTTPKPVAPAVAPGQILRLPTFYLLWSIYFIGAGAGLMVISSISGMARKSMGDAAFVAVAVMALGNAGGRIAAGFLSDKIGRRQTLLLVLLFQALLMFVAIPVAGAKGMAASALLLLATLIGFNYGAKLSLFPSFTKDLWGLKNFGLNYGLLFTAWGLGGFVLSRVQQMLTASSGGSYTVAFATAGCLLLLGAALTRVFKPDPASAG